MAEIVIFGMDLFARMSEIVIFRVDLFSRKFQIRENKSTRKLIQRKLIFAKINPLKVPFFKKVFALSYVS